MGLIAARTDKNAKAAHGISLFLVDTRDHPGFKKGKTLKKIGQPTYDTAEVIPIAISPKYQNFQLFFEDIRLPASAMLGGPDGLNKGFYMMMDELPRLVPTYDPYQTPVTIFLFKRTTGWCYRSDLPP